MKLRPVKTEEANDKDRQKLVITINKSCLEEITLGTRTVTEREISSDEEFNFDKHVIPVQNKAAIKKLAPVKKPVEQKLEAVPRQNFQSGRAAK